MKWNDWFLERVLRGNLRLCLIDRRKEEIYYFVVFRWFCVFFSFLLFFAAIFRICSSLFESLKLQTCFSASLAGVRADSPQTGIFHAPALPGAFLASERLLKQGYRQKSVDISGLDLVTKSFLKTQVPHKFPLFSEHRVCMPLSFRVL